MSDGGPTRHELVRVVYTSPQEFLRGLRCACPDLTEPAPLRYRVRQEEAVLEIGLIILPGRKIGLLDLPALEVRIRYAAGEAAACARLLAHLDLAMQRGGG